MASYYTAFSEAIAKLTDEEKAWVENIPTLDDHDEDVAALAVTLEIQYGIVLDAESLDAFPNFTSKVDADDNQWWLSTQGQEWANLDHVRWLVQAFIKTFRPDFIFKLTWAEYCSSPRVGAFGGGWLVISKDEYHYGNTWTEAEKLENSLRTGDGKV